MKLTVLMSVHNGMPYLEEAITSIRKQSFRKFEFLIIDDASTDESLACIKRHAKEDDRIRIVQNKKRLGLTKSLNKGLRISRGELIARMDADDISLKDRLKKQVEFLDEHPSVALVGTFGTIITADGKERGKLTYATATKEIKKRMPARSQFAHPSVMYRKIILSEVGYYDERLWSAQDYDFFARVLMRYDAANIPEELIKYRWDFSKGEGFTNSKRQEWNAICTRWRMVTKYGWPKRRVLSLLKPCISFLVPMSVKKKILARNT